MQLARSPLGRALQSLAILLAVTLLPAAALEKPRLRVDDYVINADLTPAKHHIRAVAQVKFTALDDISAAVFELHNGLRVVSVTSAGGAKLPVERFSQENAVRVSLPDTLAKDSSSSLTFTYEGNLASADDSPVEGLKLAYIGEDETYLLYAGRWFPLSGYGINRFTARINVAVPAGYTVIGSGKVAGGNFASGVEETAGEEEKEETPALRRKGAAAKAAQSEAPRHKVIGPFSAPGKTVFSFAWEKNSFPGTIIAGKFEQAPAPANSNVHVYFNAAHKQFAPAYADTAAKEFEFFSGWYGPAPSPTLNLVELPDDTVPSAWAPEIAAIAGRAIQQKTDYRLLANTIAHQWWGVSVSPVTADDLWLRDGGARYSEAFYVESAAGEAGFQEAMKDIEVGALAYDNIPLASIGKLDPFSPEAQSLASDKGAMLFSMLRWVLGDANYNKTIRQFHQLYAGKPVSTDDLKKMAEQNSGGQLNWFFAQWLDSTGAPEFSNKYTVYRLGSGKGFRVTGEIKQDLDLFRMPVELKIDTDGKPETRRIDVAGTDSPYSVETFGQPRKITVDPNNRVLKNSPELKLRVAILKGEQLVQQGDLAAALTQLQKALDINKLSSLAHYRVAEVFFQQHNYQAAADEYRAAESGDGEPRWTEVWSHVQLGKLFDITGQRNRATNEYRKAIETNDNTAGALDEARKYLASPYQPQSKNKVG
jgi:tetratricopeptide (TPR) repeat protein